MCLVFLWMLETVNCPGLLSETGEARAGKKGPKMTWGLRLGLKYAKRRKEKNFLATLCVSSCGGQGLVSSEIFFRFSLTNMRKRLMPDSRLQRWRHVSALLHTISITDKGHWGHIWHNHGHFLDPAACSGHFYVQTLVHSGRTLSPSRHPTPDPSVRNKPLLLLSTANEDKGEQRLDGLSSVTLHLPLQGFFVSTYSRLHIPDKTQMTSSPLTALDSRPGSGSILHINTHDPHYVTVNLYFQRKAQLFSLRTTTLSFDTTTFIRALIQR